MTSSDIVLKDNKVYQITVASVSNFPDRLQIIYWTDTRSSGAVHKQDCLVYWLIYCADLHAVWWLVLYKTSLNVGNRLPPKVEFYSGLFPA